ncbi:MAG TPA: Fic family protein [Acetobacteraceae bacterium]|jgi:Fic family protein
MYIWERPDWPRLRWDAATLAQPLAEAHVKLGRLLGRLAGLGFALQLETELQATTEEAVKNAEIEGEILNRDSVRSSIARRLGVPDAAPGPVDRRAEGIVEITLDATRNCAAPLTRERLLAWHAALFPTGRSGLAVIAVGAWRDDAHGPMQVVSALFVRETVHFQAPPASRLEAEMQAFVAWFNTPPTIDGILHAAIAHLWFVTTHPFDDGNGRIARVLADMSLARTEQSPQRFYSLSGQIRRDRNSYYGSLERTQKGRLDITEHLLWFTECFSKSIDDANRACGSILHKAEFWQRHVLTPFNERQRVLMNRLLDGFEGNLTARKWTIFGKCSMATAQRDIGGLIDRGILVRNEGGSRNSSYRLTD